MMYVFAVLSPKNIEASNFISGEVVLAFVPKITCDLYLIYTRWLNFIHKVIKNTEKNQFCFTNIQDKIFQTNKIPKNRGKTIYLIWKVLVEQNYRI